MTPEQERKAVEVLFLQELKKIEMRMAYRQHLKACKWVDKYNLPYRVATDYLKRYNKQSGVVLINECYPLPGYPAADLLTFTPDKVDSDNPKYHKSKNKDGKPMLTIDVFRHLKPEYEAQVIEHNKQYRPWNLETAAGRGAWEREFAHFLEGYDIDAFTAFDMFGSADAEENALYERKQYFKGVLDRYRSQKNAYRTSEPPYLDEYKGKYTDRKFRLDWVNRA